MFAVAYVALWVILPLAPNEAGPVEVEPHSVHSDTYGSVDVGASRNRADDAARAASEAAAAQQHLPYDAYAGTGHVPPEPPTAEAAAWAHRAQSQAPGWQAPGWQPPSWQSPNWQAPPNAGREPVEGGSPQVPGGYADPLQAGAPSSWRAPDGAAVPPPVTMQQPRRNGGVKAAVFTGSFLLFFGIAALLAENIDGIAWWQFWPLALVIVGIVLMALAVAMMIPPIRYYATDRLLPLVKAYARQLIDVLTNPKELSFSVLGMLILNVATGLEFWAALLAFGQMTNPLETLFIFLVANAIGSAVPTPGGLGGVEAALMFSFGAAGVPAGIALSATLLYRALFYWLRIPLGALSMRWLDKHNLI